MAEKLYVTNEDGVVLDTIDSDDSYVKLSEGDKVIRKGVLQYLNDTVDMKYHYVKINPFSYGIISNLIGLHVIRTEKKPFTL